METNNKIHIDKISVRLLNEPLDSEMPTNGQFLEKLHAFEASNSSVDEFVSSKLRPFKREASVSYERLTFMLWYRRIRWVAFFLAIMAGIGIIMHPLLEKNMGLNESETLSRVKMETSVDKASKPAIPPSNGSSENRSGYINQDSNRIHHLKENLNGVKWKDRLMGTIHKGDTFQAEVESVGETQELSWRNLSFKMFNIQWHRIHPALAVYPNKHYTPRSPVQSKKNYFNELMYRKPMLGLELGLRLMMSKKGKYGYKFWDTHFKEIVQRNRMQPWGF